MKFELTKSEKSAIATLKQLSKKWPDSLWLFSANGTLCIMKKPLNEHHIFLHHGGVDPKYIVDTIDIENDGGDW